MFNMDIYKIPPATPEQRPEKESFEEKMVNRVVHGLNGTFKNLFAARPSCMKQIVKPVTQTGRGLEKLNDNDLKEKIRNISRKLKQKGLNKKEIIQAFALIRETAWRTVHMKHFKPQIAGAYAMLNNMVAEMDTGEGKTLTATLTASTVAMAGIPVHIISVNDYLTKRDATLMAPIYEFCNLSVGYVVHDMDRAQKREAYACDITYCTNKEIAFDYLKDKLVLKNCSNLLSICAGYLKGGGSDVDKLMMRGLHFAIVDEADSVLIDEARTPLIISQSIDNKEEEKFYEEALDVALQLIEKKDYLIYQKDRMIRLTEAGKITIKTLTNSLNVLWESSVRREEFIISALSAQIFFKKNRQYLVKDGKVQIIDEFTGRVMADRSWEKGLHQLIEKKENCKLSNQKETLARMSYQKFFRKYLMLSGMTGTAKEVKKELWSVYGLLSVKIAPNKKRMRKKLSDRIHPTIECKWQDVVKRVTAVYKQKRPVLIGTKSVADSEYLGALLIEKGLEIQILNARQDKEEALIIAEAGKIQKITVATNMAGRGTDIKLSKQVIALKGLHVILTQRHDAGRIDRQLEGRCGRQGEPGSFEVIVSLEDDIKASQFDRALGRIIGKLIVFSPKTFKLLGRWHLLRIQKKIEKQHARIRKEVFKQDSKRDKMLSFAGEFE